MKPKPTCQDCGVVVSRRDTKRCSPCARRFRHRAYTCDHCSGPVSRARSKWCRPCTSEHRRETETCPDCGGWKQHGNQRCQACHQAILSSRSGDWQQIVLTFSEKAFDAEINRADLEWTPSQLALASGVSGTTIRRWLAGRAKPKRTELLAVLAALAFERCPTCKGLGHIDPSSDDLEALEQRVTPKLIPVQSIRQVPTLPSGPLHVGALVVDPGTRTISLGGRNAELTPAETALFVALASRPDTLLTYRELAEVAGAASDNAANTHLNRAKVKLRQIGARGYLLSGKGSGNMLSSRTERDSERTEAAS